MLIDNRKETHPIRVIALKIAELDMWLDECCKLPVMFDINCKEVIQIVTEDNGYTVTVKMYEQDIMCYTILCTVNDFNKIIYDFIENTESICTTNIVHFVSLKELRQFNKGTYSKYITQINQLLNN